ncbi:uncharacterized protein BO87DRAFT_348906 [Aspergillus neoniger CBS 115656]|uniref:ATPase AAA-type core domain-containing protein n=1 Tax=Aspergillus neoniger (strain CBS 115656) TaxID=1448310 RepID=A0A318YW62_ASPNB|nr:hypothetical protein BO87DRAFT_348906 [Aspergillus neoniger CBS 115656]PYH39111.1 hypothetical protein BO87DRAFT_348906 [Aspergillus neoniger CBS 115656]
MAAVNDPQPLPKRDEQVGLSGFYHDQGDGGNQGDVVAGARTVKWFKSKELSASLLGLLDSLQLVTSSDDNGSTVAGANRSWFELSIYRRGDEALNRLRWMSHENRFMTNDREYVHAAADHEDSRNRYHKGTLIFGINVENNVKPADVPSFRALLGLARENPNAASTFEYLGNSTADQVEDRIRGSGRKPIVSRLRWVSADRIVTLANASQRAEKNVLLVFDADDLLRSTTTDRRLSWGQTVENIWRVMEGTCRRIGKQSPNNYFHLLIQIGFEGAIYKGFHTQGTKAHLIYEPTSAEGKLIRSYSDNDMRKFGFIGFIGDKWEKLKKELMVAWERGLVSSLEEESAGSIADLGITQMRDAMMTGIRWSRRCAPIMFPKGNTQKFMPTNDRMKLESGSEPVLVSVELDLIVQDENAQEQTFRKPLVLDSLPCSTKKAAHDTLTHGFECVLPYMPGARFGNLVTADRGEVDGFRKIANTVEEWYRYNREPKPLSIAVFGQPGSGKSFGVKEVIRDTLKADRDNIVFLEYNLSQLQHENELQRAFEAIRTTRGMPIVFFDEFDSTFQGRQLGWLPHFLKSITRGVYKDGAVERPLGRGIYIFIGGTKSSHEEFFRDISDSSGLVRRPEETPDFCRSEKHVTALLDELNRNPDRTSGPTLTSINLDISEVYQYSDLKDTFSQVQSEILSGRLPLVFFENFDSDFGDEKLGWLKYFLAPMQDGEYLDNSVRCPIGRAIFFFEQGTDHFNGFPEVSFNSEDFQGAKVLDFVSRLRGYVKHEINYTYLNNVLNWYLKSQTINKPLSIGVFRNCQRPPSQRLGIKKIFKDNLAGHVNILGPSSLGRGDETYFVLRRAMLLRSMLQRNFGFGEGEFIDMDPGVLNALLFTPRVLHGARSLESILSMSRIPKRVKITKEDLCTEDQRMLHVKDEAFQRLLNSTGVDSGTQATKEDMRRYAWIERKSGRAYQCRTVVPATPAAGSGTA